MNSTHFNILGACPSSSTIDCLNYLPSAESLLQESDQNFTFSPLIGNSRKGNRWFLSRPLPLHLQKKIKARISPYTCPWSQAFLDQAANFKTLALVVDYDLRRSERKKDQLKCFKSSGCPHSNCIGCSMKPPVLPPSMVRNLGESFCKIDGPPLTDEALLKKKKVAGPGGKKPASRKPAPKEDDALKTKKSIRK
uniref:Uncharacterized protein n=1 Tax=Setaria viridis TaxID=4556 RepID=A0A4U6U5N2_SETVI|nr:hypothetical protein SEVIR_6G105300v2 [Setaria viridis]